jgi:enoyl-CoA hydratase/carnithine racemase
MAAHIWEDGDLDERAMRFASREKAIISQFEVGAGFVPGGGPMARLPRLVGCGRAMEILIGADDFNGELAERYGYVNRALPDEELALIEKGPGQPGDVERHLGQYTAKYKE